MAYMLNLRYSAERLQNIVRRHMRLCKQTVNDNDLTAQIQPEFDAITQTQQTINNRQMDKEDCYDDLVLADLILDDEVRNTFAHCEKYDRANPAERVTVQVFPDEKYGDLVRYPIPREVKEVEKIIVRIDALGPDHELVSSKTELQGKLQCAIEALTAYEKSIHTLKMAEAEAEIAKENLVRQYERNYLSARGTYGRNTAERLFPKISRSKKIEELLDDETDENAA